MKLATIVFVLLCGPLFAQTAYYVSPSGSDSNPGTIDQPFATPAKAEAATVNCSATTVYFRQGAWYGTIPLIASGCAGNIIVWQNYPGESVTLSGGMQVTNWINVTGNLWQTTLPVTTANFEALYYNGVRRFRPRLGATASNSLLGLQFRVSPIAGYYDRFTYSAADPVTTPIPRIQSATWTLDFAGPRRDERSESGCSADVESLCICR